MSRTIFTAPLLLASACLMRVDASPAGPGPGAPAAPAAPAVPAAPAAACAVPDPGDDEPAPLTSDLEGCFQRGPRPDRDRYRVVVPGAGPRRVTIAIERGDTAVGIRYDAADLGGRDLGSGFTNDARRELAFDAMGGAPLLLDVRTGGFGRDDERYRVTMTTAPDDPGEPDDRLEDARPLSAPHTARITGRLSLDGRVAGDLDHYRLDVDRAGTLVVEATQVERARLRLTLFDRDGRRVGAPAFRGHGDDVRLTAAVAPGAYVVRVEDINGAPQATEPRHYRLTARLP